MPVPCCCDNAERLADLGDDLRMEGVACGDCDSGLSIGCDDRVDCARCKIQGKE